MKANRLVTDTARTPATAPIANRSSNRSRSDIHVVRPAPIATIIRTTRRLITMRALAEDPRPDPRIHAHDACALQSESIEQSGQGQPIVDAASTDLGAHVVPREPLDTLCLVGVGRVAD